MAFRFVHTADLHLDSPLRSLSLRNTDLASLVGDATRQALIGIVDLCIEEEVDALVIAGDLYDGDQTSMKTARFLAVQMERLHAAGIQVFKIRGNHDALSKITQELVLPPSLKIFGGRAETIELQTTGLTIAIHGLSFAKPHAPESLLPKYKAPVSGAINIGLMHTSLAGSPGHDAYAPCAAADLHASGFNYWALGHIHHRSMLSGSATIIMPGMPQGRDINEAGEKSVSIVTVGDDGGITVEERLTSIAEFRRIDIDIRGLEDWRDVIDRVETVLARERAATRSPHLVARIRITGATPLAWRLRRDADLLRENIEHRAGHIGATWIDKIELAVEPVVERLVAGADPIVELGHLMRDNVIASAGFRGDIRQMVKELLDDLPAESRRFAGQDDLAFEAFLDELMREGAEDIAARMKATTQGEA